MDEMTPVERIKAAIALQPVDRVPILPKIDASFAARSHGVKIAEVVRNHDLAMELVLQTYDELGGVDASFSTGMNDLGFAMMGMITKLPGYQLGDDELWQLVDQEVMTLEDYDFVVKNGWNAFIPYVYPRLNGVVPPEQFMERMMEGGALGAKDMATWEAKGVPTTTGFGPFVPIEAFRFTRSFKGITNDIFRHPEKVQTASEAYLEEQLPQTIGMIQATNQSTKFGYMGAFLGQGYCTMLSPRHFDKFFWPYEVRIVDALIEAGITPWMHSDSNWDQYIDRFLALPKGKIVMDLDSMTDIFKAKQILKDHMCIAGDVPPAMLKLGTPEEVKAYVKKLIDLVGEDGGFMLSSGCSVPVDARFENVKAMVDTGKNYYPHHKVFKSSAIA